MIHIRGMIHHPIHHQMNAKSFRRKILQKNQNERDSVDVLREEIRQKHSHRKSISVGTAIRISPSTKRQTQNTNSN